MDQNQKVSQHAMDILGEQPAIAPATAVADKIGPLVEYLLQALGIQQAPQQKAFTSSQMAPMPAGQRSALQQQMMGQQGFVDPATQGQPRIPGVKY